MRKIIFSIVLMMLLSMPQYAFANEMKLNMNVIRQEDGITSAEICYNDRMVWRVTLLSDGAKPVVGGNETHTTFLTPDIIDGCFLLKINTGN